MAAWWSPSSWTLSTSASSTQLLSLTTLGASAPAWPSSACCSSPSLAASSTTCTVSEGVSSHSAQVSPTLFCLSLVHQASSHCCKTLSPNCQCDSSCCQTSLSPERVRSQEGVQLPRAAGSLWFGPAGGCRNNSFLVFSPSPGSEAVLSCPVGCTHHGQTQC